jgi:hypothetical protein
LAVGVVDAESLRRPRRHAERAPPPRGANGIPNRWPGQFLHCIAAAWKKSIEKND